MLLKVGDKLLGTSVVIATAVYVRITVLTMVHVRKILTANVLLDLMVNLSGLDLTAHFVHVLVTSHGLVM
jgi:phage-related tail fiber protein